MPIALAMDTIIALFKRYKSLFLIAPLLIALAVQTARIEGFLWFDGLKADLAECKANHAREVQEAEQARAIAKAKSDQLAKESTVPMKSAPLKIALLLCAISSVTVSCAPERLPPKPVPVTIPAHLLKRPPMPSWLQSPAQTLSPAQTPAPMR